MALATAGVGAIVLLAKRGFKLKQLWLSGDIVTFGVTVTTEPAVLQPFATRHRLKGDLVLYRSVYKFRRVSKQLLVLFELSKPVVCAVAEPLLSLRSVDP